MNDIYTPQPATIRVDSAGSVTFVPASAAAAVTMNLAAGDIIPCQVRQITASAGTFHILS